MQRIMTRLHCVCMENWIIPYCSEVWIRSSRGMKRSEVFSWWSTVSRVLSFFPETQACRCSNGSSRSAGGRGGAEQTVC